LETVVHRVSAWYIIGFSTCNVRSSGTNCPSAGCASAANVVRKGGDVFGTKIVSHNQITQKVLSGYRTIAAFKLNVCRCVYMYIFSPHNGALMNYSCLTYTRCIVLSFVCMCLCSLPVFIL
jgi:hypothetical protein